MSCGDLYIAKKQEVEEILASVNRPVDSATLIAVSKTKPVEMLKEVYERGCRDFGENKVQELCDKYPLLPNDIRWHLIGHLQTNKVKYIADKVYMIHSVDTVKLAETIDKEAKKHNRIIPILIEVNVAEEETKFGLKTEEVVEMVRTISVLPNVKIKGLMTIAPYTENEEENRPYFAVLKQLSVDITSQNIDNVDMEFLSMGMTGDYRTALTEGSTFVRIGTGIFGERNYGLIGDKQ